MTWKSRSFTIYHPYPDSAVVGLFTVKRLRPPPRQVGGVNQLLEGNRVVSVLYRPQLVKYSHRCTDSSRIVHESNCLAPGFADLVCDFVVVAIDSLESIVLVVCYSHETFLDVVQEVFQVLE